MKSMDFFRFGNFIISELAPTREVLFFYYMFAYAMLYQYFICISSVSDRLFNGDPFFSFKRLINLKRVVLPAQELTLHEGKIFRTLVLMTNF